MEQNMHFTTPYEQVEAMYNEGAPEYVVDQGMYYPTATNYGYYNTGFESPGEWEDQRRVFGADSPDFQYTGAQNESPYVYYTPSYGYAQSPYNPYNPYIPGAMIGVDGQQYYTIPPYQNSVSSPTYVPFVVQPDVIPNSATDSFYDTGASINRPADGGGIKYNMNSASGALANTHKTPSSQMSPLTRLLEKPRGNVGPSKQVGGHGSVSSGRFPAPAHQTRSSSGSVSAVDNLSNGKVSPYHNQLKVAIPVGNGLSDFRSGVQERGAVAKLRPRFHVGRALNDIQGIMEPLGEQNCGPRTNRLQNQLTVKAYTTKAGDSNAQGNIIIRTDQYNKDSLPVDYAHAKFFVIKSYSEDDVHKSVKYNVWSSTPHGNKKLCSTYEDAQRIAAGKPGGCPIFLFFSVNASGQFCGVAEMVGQVDFNKDMDFWQQDKWSGSFPVVWHIIKDVPNTSVRHIILENNENKPVTNSRDTQEIMYKKGLEMLKVFKNHTMKTSLLDDFMYYEDRQKIMQDERGRFHVRNYETPFTVAAMGPPRKLNPVGELPHNKEEKGTKANDVNNLNKSVVSATEQEVSSNTNVEDASTTEEASEKKAVEDDAVSTLKIGSLTINPEQVEPTSSAGAASKSFDVVNVGSIPVRVNGYAESLGTLTVGTIPLDPRALKLEKGGSLNKNGK